MHILYALCQEFIQITTAMIRRATGAEMKTHQAYSRSDRWHCSAAVMLLQDVDYLPRPSPLPNEVLADSKEKQAGTDVIDA